MNFLTIIKLAGSVLAFLATHTPDIQKLVTDAESVFAEAKQGPSKLAYVIAGIYGLAEEAGAEFVKFPVDQVLPFLSGRIGQIVSKLFPQAASAKAAAAIAG